MKNFFVDQCSHFFRPFNSKYREQVMACLRQLYARLYSSKADYSRILVREQLVELFQEAITRTPVLDDEQENEFVLPSRGEREQAIWVLNLLLEHGWLEKHVDEASFSSRYSFTQVGRQFTLPMLESDGSRFRTRHRNTRNTRNSLQSFVDNFAEGGEVYDLLDAYESSERIVSDFADVIAELDERKRQLVQEVEASQVIQRASEEFFDFMETRFIPDLAVRLSADSVEKHRDAIQKLLDKARRKSRSFKVDAERELRDTVPELLVNKQSSIYMTILDDIEKRIHSASEIMLPALRKALHGFTRRADIIIRQLSFSSTNQQGDLLKVCKSLASLDSAQQEQRLQAAANQMSLFKIGLVDPNSLRLHTRQAPRIVNSHVEMHDEMDHDSRRELLLQQTLGQAFVINNQGLRRHLHAALSDNGRVYSQDLPVNDAKELLMVAHAIEAGSAGERSSEYHFHVEPTGKKVANEYFDCMDEFVIELRKN